MKSDYKLFRLRPACENKVEMPANYFVLKSSERIREKTIRIQLNKVESTSPVSVVLRVQRKGSCLPTIYKIEFHH